MGIYVADAIFRLYVTDPEDFIFITLIPLTLLGIAWQHFRRPNSSRWIRFAERAGCVFAVLGPLVPLAVLYLACWRPFEVTGYWSASTHDSKILLGQDALYKQIFSRVTYALAFGGWCMISLGAILLHLRHQVPAHRLVWMVSLFVIASAIFAMEPTGRLDWWTW